MKTNFSFCQAFFKPKWMYAHIDTKTPYIPGSGLMIDAQISLDVALHGVNITLDARPQKGISKGVLFNEKFSWEWEQGRNGFGQFGMKLQYSRLVLSN